MNQQKCLIFIGAHPDDETFGLGAVLTQYAAKGVKVYYLCATRGEAGIAEAQYMQDYTDPGDMRWAELTCAAKVLKLSGIEHLGYRDSGMAGTEDNKNPRALINAPLEEVAGRMVKFIRILKPDVVITHDESGGYGHPDHIAVHNAAVKAFYASGDINQYPEAGPAFQPAKLYFGIQSHRLFKFMIKLMPLFGQNPHRFGRNKDIDLTRVMSVDYPIHTAIRLSKQEMKTRNQAAACHASQGGGQPPSGGVFRLAGFISSIHHFFSGQHSYFLRAYPPFDSKRRERDLFEGLEK